MNLSLQIGKNIKKINQDVKSGKRNNITLKNFSNIMKSLGCKIYVKKGKKNIPLSLG